MKKSKEMNGKGFTLIELMVALVVSSILVGGIFYYFTTQEKAYTIQEQITEMQQNARGGLDFMVRELRMIGYKVDTGEIITEADGDAITFLGDIDGDGTAETIRYSLDTTDLQLAREVGSGGGIPLAEDIPDTGLVFQYYDDSDNDLSASDPLPLTANNRKAIRRINVSLTARTARPDPEYSANNGYRTTSFTTDIRPRNMGLINLGCSAPATPTLDGTNTAGLNSTYPCQLHVEWSAVTTDVNGSSLGTECALTKYLVYYDISSGSYGNSVEATSSDTDITFSAPPACSYYVTVSAVNSSGEGSKATEISIADTTPPGTPTALTLTPLDNEIDLSWNVPTSDNCDIAGYEIYRSTYDNSSYSLLYTTDGLGSIYNDTSVTNCTTYYYKVRAIDKCANEGNYSNEASDAAGSAPPREPTGMSVTVNSNNDISVRWDAPVNNTDDTAFISGDPAGYNVYRDTDTSFPSPVQVNTGLVNSSPYNDNSMSDADTTIYYYKVTAVDVCGNESAYSDYAASPILTVTFGAGFPYKSSGQRKVRVEVNVVDQYSQPVTDAAVTVTVTGTDAGNTTPESMTLSHNGGGNYGSGITPKTYWEGSIRYNSMENVTVVVTAEHVDYPDSTISITFN